MWIDDNDKIIDILKEEIIKSKEYFPVICPVCKRKQGHLYAHRYKEGEDRGGEWVWCSACHSYAHFSARLPKWWKNLELIEFSKLAAVPDYLEENKTCIDEWINSLISANRSYM